jgi:hypothetical protein
MKILKQNLTSPYIYINKWIVLFYSDPTLDIEMIFIKIN